MEETPHNVFVESSFEYMNYVIHLSEDMSQLNIDKEQTQKKDTLVDVCVRSVISNATWRNENDSYLYCK